MDSQWTHNGLTMDSQWTHNGLTMDSQWTHKGLTKDSHRIHTKIIEKALVLLGCPRKRLFLHWFYKVVREKCCFYIGFTRVVREKPYKTCVKTTFFVDNPPGMVSPQEEEQQQEVNWPHNSPSYTIESLISRSLARTHERNETISRLAVSQKDSPPQPPI